MSNFRCLSYCSIYESSGIVEHSMEPDTCFHTVTKDEWQEHMENDYKIVFFKGFGYSDLTYRNNACSLEKEAINEYLKIVSQYVKFNYDLSIKQVNWDSNYEITSFGLEDCSQYDLDYFVLKFYLSGNILQHKFLLKMIRGLYEYPFNVFLLDTMKLLKHPRYKHYGLANMYMFVSHANCVLGCSANDDQSISTLEYETFPKLNKSFSEWKTLLDYPVAEHVDYDGMCPYNVNHMHTYEHIRGLGILSLSAIFRRAYASLYNRDNIYSYDFWDNNSMFEERLKLYNKLIKFYK